MTQVNSLLDIEVLLFLHSCSPQSSILSDASLWQMSAVVVKTETDLNMLFPCVRCVGAKVQLSLNLSPHLGDASLELLGQRYGNCGTVYVLKRNCIVSTSLRMARSLTTFGSSATTTDSEDDANRYVRTHAQIREEFPMKRRSRTLSLTA